MARQKRPVSDAQRTFLAAFDALIHAGPGEAPEREKLARAFAEDVVDEADPMLLARIRARQEAERNGAKRYGPTPRRRQAGT